MRNPFSGIDIFKLTGRTGKILSGTLAFWFVFAASFGIIDHVCKSRNTVDAMLERRSFPVLVFYPDHGKNGRTSLMRYGDGRTISRQGTYYLPENPPDIGVFRPSHISYKSKDLQGDRIRITLYNYPRSTQYDWGKAAYQVEGRKVTPLLVCGGSNQSHWAVNALFGLCAACLLRLLGQFLSFLSARPSPKEIISRFSCLPLHRDPMVFLIIIPFFYYAWVMAELIPYNMADSYAYLWRRPVNFYFFTGRSFTQRILYLLCGSNLRIIMAVQLAIFAAAACILYGLAARHLKAAGRVAAALFVVFVSHSYMFNVSATSICAEPVYNSMLLVFSGVLLLGDRKQRFYILFALVSGILFIYSKNTAPYIVLVLLGVHALTRFPRKPVSALMLYAPLLFFSAFSAYVTQKHDTSVHMNNVNSICAHVLPDPDASELFRKKYGMPEGDWSRRMKGKTCNYVLDGKRLYYVDRETLNFILVPDKHGFIEWAVSKGRPAYLRYLFFDAPVKTFETFRAEFNREYRGDSLFTGPRLIDAPEWMRGSRRSNTERLTEALGKDGLRGYFGFDPVLILQKLVLKLGIGNLAGTIALFLLSLLISFFAREKGLMPFVSGLLIGGTALQFISIFADGYNQPRHAYPPAFMVVLGAVLFVPAAVHLGLLNGGTLCRLFKAISRRSTRIFQKASVR